MPYSFSSGSNSWVMLGFVIGFNNLEKDLGLLTFTDFMSPSFGIFDSFWCLFHNVL